MNRSKEMRDFGDKVRSEYEKEFADEWRIADELFNLYIEAAEITNQQWQLKPERREILELISRIFNYSYAGWQLVMEGMSSQGMTLFRDTIECANYIKLLEADEEFRNEWREGKDFFLRDIRAKMKKKGISFPPQDQYYKTFSRSYVHPSKKGTVSHVVDWYPTVLEHRILFLLGSIRDVPRTRFLAGAALILTWVNLYFLWVEMFPIDKTKYPEWYDKFNGTMKQLHALKVKSDKEWSKLIQKQFTNINKIFDDQYKALESEVRDISGRWVSARELVEGSGQGSQDEH